MFNPERLELARKRRRFTAKSLAEKAGIAPVTLSRIVNRQQIPDERTVSGLVDALSYPRDFFFQDDIDPIDASVASFRSLTGISARESDAACAAGSLASVVIAWVPARFTLQIGITTCG